MIPMNWRNPYANNRRHANVSIQGPVTGERHGALLLNQLSNVPQKTASLVGLRLPRAASHDEAEAEGQQADRGRLGDDFLEEDVGQLRRNEIRLIDIGAGIAIEAIDLAGVEGHEAVKGHRVIGEAVRTAAGEGLYIDELRP